MENHLDLISIVLLATTIVLTLIELYLRNQQHYKAAILIPGPKIWPIIGNFHKFFFLNAGKFDGII